MSPSPIDKDKEDSLFKRPTGMLLDERQWLFLKKRYHLTNRELQVAILICQGFDNDEITNALKIKQSTVKTHLRNVYRRARVKNKILLLLRFVEDVNKFYVPSERGTPSIPISEIKPKAGRPTKAPSKQ